MFPKTRELELVSDATGWQWTQLHPDKPDIWKAVDRGGEPWFVKFRGSANALEERAFSVIAQELGISCQSAKFLDVPADSDPWKSLGSGPDPQIYPVALSYFEKHGVYFCDDCPIELLYNNICNYGHDISLLNNSKIKNALDIARGEMLAFLCEVHDGSEKLITTQHMFVQIDNETGFRSGGDNNPFRSPWARETEEGRREAEILCEKFADLGSSVIDEALRVPIDFPLDLVERLKRNIAACQERARDPLQLKLEFDIRNQWESEYDVEYS